MKVFQIIPFNLLNLLLFQLFEFSLVVFISAYDGVPMFNCPIPKGVPISAVPCDDDCKKRHGADYGYCDGEICRCGPITHIAQISLDNQCQPSTGILRQAFKRICDIDCKCNHGTDGGTCRFRQQICDCGEWTQTNACTSTLPQINNLLNSFGLSQILIG